MLPRDGTIVTLFGDAWLNKQSIHLYESNPSLTSDLSILPRAKCCDHVISLGPVQTRQIH